MAEKVLREQAEGRLQKYLSEVSKSIEKLQKEQQDGETILAFIDPDHRPLLAVTLKNDAGNGKDGDTVYDKYEEDLKRIISEFYTPVYGDEIDAYYDINVEKIAPLEEERQEVEEPVSLIDDEVKEAAEIHNIQPETLEMLANAAQDKAQLVNLILSFSR